MMTPEEQQRFLADLQPNETTVKKSFDDNNMLDRVVRDQLIPAFKAYIDEANHDENKVESLQAALLITSGVLMFAQNTGRIPDEHGTKTTAAFVLLVTADITLELSAKYIRLFNDNDTPSQDINHKIIKNLEQYGEPLCHAENNFDDIIHSDRMLLNIKKRIIRESSRLMRLANPLIISESELLGHIKRKNQNHTLFKGHFNGELIFNADADVHNKVDDTVVEMAVVKLNNICSKAQSRTQFVICVQGGLEHAIMLDASWDSERKRLNLICLESSNLYAQWSFLSKLGKALDSRNIDYATIACQTKLQTDPYNCAIFSLGFAGITSKTSFEKLNDSPGIGQPLFAFMDKKKSCKPLKKTKWISVTALGEKAAKMAQSLTMMEDHLETLYRGNPELVASKMDLWKRMYDMSREKQNYYIDYRRISLQAKFKQLPFYGLTTQRVLDKVRKTPDSAVSKSLAIRHLAIDGPMRELSFLLNDMSEAEINEQATKSKSTALHLAIRANKPNRAFLLLQRGASSKIQDNKGVTAEQYIADKPEFVALKQFCTK